MSVPPTADIALIGAVGVVAGSAITLIGTAITNCRTLVALRDQMKHEKTMGKDNLRLEKLEELYDLLQKTEVRITKADNVWTQHVVTSSPAATYIKKWDEAMSGWREGNARINVLTALYFPGLKDLTDALTQSEKAWEGLKMKVNLALMTGADRTTFESEYATAKKALEDARTTLLEAVVAKSQELQPKG